MMRWAERKLEKKRWKKGGSKWEKIGWDEDKKICPFDAKKVCPVTLTLLSADRLLFAKQKETVLGLLL